MSTIRRTPRHRATVIATRELTPRMRRLTLSAPTLLRGWPLRPAQDVELLLTDETGRRVKRRYTIRRARPATGEFDLDALVHGTAHSPGACWAASAQPGDPVDFVGPRGRLELSDADWHLFVGDESALPAIAELIEALPVGQAAIALLEVGDASDELPLSRPRGGELTARWIQRKGAEPGRPELLTAGLVSLPVRAGTGRAYLLGESRAMVALRPHVRVHGIDDSAMYLKGYWNLGRVAPK